MVMKPRAARKIERGLRSAPRAGRGRHHDDTILYIHALVAAAHPLIVGAERQVACLIDDDGPVEQLRHLCAVLHDAAVGCDVMIDGIVHNGKGALPHQPATESDPEEEAEIQVQEVGASAGSSVVTTPGG
ncbi:MAG: hypothetical protein MUF10_15410 [Thermoanaerobaculaceae bacterium]|jgi:hypothetical protein|nr:hypothetical protein [Thermoanaerobaculaceae bacterium]